nr:FtsK/SpoIIIE domain-containing protein [Mycolicibacterium mageritense]
MSRYRPDASSRTVVDSSSNTVRLTDLLGIEDFAQLDLTKQYASTRLGPPFEKSAWGRDWLRFPIARDPFGNVVHIDLKEDAEGGMGSAMAVVGTSGSGKSEFWTTLLQSAALTHSPEQLQFMFFDFKGDTTAMTIREFPHTVAAQNNLKDDSLWMERMCDVLLGELEIRKKMLARGRCKNAAEYEYRRIHKGEKLPPLPHLLIVVDEFTQMFQECPQMVEVADEYGRQARALGAKLLMGSQYLGHQMARGIMSNMPIRVALRVVDAADSRTIIGVDDARWLPTQPAGAGFLLSQGRDLQQFQTAYVGGTYHKPRKVVATEEARAQETYAPAREFLLTGMEPVKVAAPAPVQVVDDESDVLIGEDGRELAEVQVAARALQEQTAGMAPLKQKWLPPLEALPVDELVRRLRGRPWHVDYGVNRELLMPVGVEDRPYDHLQKVYAVNVLDDNCMVVGKAGSGKTVALTTMITGAALMYTPKRVQFFVLAFSGADINAVKDLPHVSSFARGTDRNRVLSTLTALESLLSLREHAGVDMKVLREQKFGGRPATAEHPMPDEPYGDVFLVIDGWKRFKDEYEDASLINGVTRVLALMEKGPGYGVHVLVSALGRNAVGSQMPNLYTSNVELKLEDNDDLTKNNRDVAKKVPLGYRPLHRPEPEPGAEDTDSSMADQAAARDTPTGELAEAEDEEMIRIIGRGTSMNGYHFQTGLPHLTVGADVVELDRALPLITRVTGGRDESRQLKLLPTLVTLDQVFSAAGQFRRVPGSKDMRVPFGISEKGLVPAFADFGRKPHLLVAGNPGCGMTTALATLARSIMRVFSPDEAEIFVVDNAHGLANVVVGPHLGTYVDSGAPPPQSGYGRIGTGFGEATAAFTEASEPEPPAPRVRREGYVHKVEQMRSLAAYLAEEMAARQPDSDLTQEQLAAGEGAWKGKHTFVIVDRENDVQALGGDGFSLNSGHPLAALEPFLSNASEVGLHVIVGRRVAGWTRANGSPLVGPLLRTQEPAVVMSSDKSEGEIAGGVKGAKLEDGRGVYVEPLGAGRVQIAVSDPQC